MNSRRFVSAAVLALLSSVTVSAASATPSSADPSIPNGQYDTYLESVDAVSSSDVWVVGRRSPPCCGNGDTHPLVKHWDGSEWKTIPSYSGPGELNSVAAVSTDDVWAVGDYWSQGGGGEQVLVLHWNGTEWSQASIPTFPGDYNRLTDVSFISPTNVIVHGYYYSGEGPVFRISLVWDGSTWQEGSGAVANLTAVDALTPKDAWGAGFTVHSYAAHWNGKVWKESPTVYLGPLSSVTAISSDDVWVSGSNQVSPKGFFEHWDGTTWTKVEDPHSEATDEITGLSGTASDDVWASGYTRAPQVHGFLQHWDGHSWSDIANPAGAKLESQILDVVALSRTDAWAVGFYDSGHFPFTRHKLLLHWDGTKWSSNTTHH